MKSLMIVSQKPLAGKRIVLTRSREQARELVQALERSGAEVLLLPTVAFAPPEDCTRLDEALHHLDRFGTILFLSQNAVRYVLSRCRELGIQYKAFHLPGRVVAAVGPATAKAAAQEGLHVDYVAKSHTGESLVDELRDSLAGRSVLLPRSNLGDDRVRNALRAAGAHVTEVIAYRTIAPQSMDSGVLGFIRRGEADVIFFASSSAFQNLANSIGSAKLAALSQRVRFAAIGPTTAKAIREAGARLAIEVGDLAPSGAEGIADAIVAHYQQPPSQSVGARSA
jgi:uroporphyrinogen-III synthase